MPSVSELISGKAMTGTPFCLALQTGLLSTDNEATWNKSLFLGFSLFKIKTRNSSEITFIFLSYLVFYDSNIVRHL